MIMMEENEEIKSKYLIFCEAFLCKFFTQMYTYILVESLEDDGNCNTGNLHRIYLERNENTPSTIITYCCVLCSCSSMYSKSKISRRLFILNNFNVINT